MSGQLGPSSEACSDGIFSDRHLTDRSHAIFGAIQQGDSDGDVMAVMEAGLPNWKWFSSCGGPALHSARGERMGLQRQMLYLLVIVLALGGVLYAIGVL